MTASLRKTYRAPTGRARHLARFAPDSPLEGTGFELSVPRCDLNAPDLTRAPGLQGQNGGLAGYARGQSADRTRPASALLGIVPGRRGRQWDVAAARQLLVDERQHPRQTARVSALSRSRGHRRLSQAKCRDRGEGLRHPRLAASPPGPALNRRGVPVRKIAARGAPPARPGGDDLPYVYSDSMVVRGHGRAEVTATGPRTARSAKSALRSRASTPNRRGCASKHGGRSATLPPSCGAWRAAARQRSSGLVASSFGKKARETYSL
jgi:hypothetical protein